jgi:excinuclease ABC subunit C
VAASAGLPVGCLPPPRMGTGLRDRHNRGVLPAVKRLPSDPGVYRFRDGNARVLYIGRATDLRGRVASYWSDVRDRPHLTRMVAAVARVEAVVCDSVHEAAWLERNLLEERLPRWNRTPGGQEVPVYLLLDDNPATPGLRVVHRPVRGRIFGPYLGGLRARLAVSGLHKIHPLAYAGSGLTGAGQDLAGRRGVGPADREPLAAALAGILSREPAAVHSAHAGLTRLRDAASAAQAYERAATIQAELAALEWITSPQRATAMDGADTVFHAWSDGVLVRFAVHDGRLCEWTQRRTRKAPQSPPPGSWAAFAERNAALAAALS